MLPANARLIFLVLASGSAVFGQRVVSAKSGFVLFVQGRVSVESGRLKTGQSYRQLKAGESLSTERGRAEVLLNPGTILRLGDSSRLHMDDIRLTDACVSLESGSAVVTVNRILKADHIRLISGGSVIILKREGVYRFDQGRLRVFSGVAEVRREGSNAAVTVKRGHAVSLDDGSHIAKFDIKDEDDLERWADSRSRNPFPRGFGLRALPPRVGWQAADPAPGANSSVAPTPSTFSSSQF